jgi:hypothetical protein
VSALVGAVPSVLPELLAGPVRAATLGAAERAGADPDGLFCAAAVTGPAAALLDSGPWSELITRGETLVVLAQVSDVGVLARLVAPLAGGNPVGFGLVRQGWTGARESCLDALDAHELAVRRRADARFADEWVAATLFAARERLHATWEKGEAVAVRSAHLADAVRAFADNGLSVVAASRALHIHPNTVIYRLERWEQLTGWDARSYPGLVMSMTCLEAVR